MALKVIGSGLGRTGTLSLKTALEHLGFNPCHHMKEVGIDPKQIDWFLRASKGEKVNWKLVFDKFEAAVDWPAAAYYKELSEEFPDAKIVMGIRDPEAWYQSVSETIYTVAPNVPGWLKFFVPPAKKWVQMVEQTIWANELEGRFEDKTFAIEFFNRRIAEVKQNIPADRLLVHQPQDGWEPLCKFLDLPVPATTYPWVNEGKEIKRAVKLLKILKWLPLFLLTTVLIFFLN